MWAVIQKCGMGLIWRPMSLFAVHDNHQQIKFNCPEQRRSYKILGFHLYNAVKFFNKLILSRFYAFICRNEKFQQFKIYIVTYSWSWSRLYNFGLL